MHNLGHSIVANILLVEDSIADQVLIARAVRKSGFNTKLYVVGDGVEAMSFLYHQGAYQDLALSPRPDLILLDINMPKMDGKQVLQKIREDQTLHNLPVIMLTTSNQERDIVDSYKLGVNAYITKPNTLEGFIIAVKTLEDFWFDVVELPSS